MARRKINSTRRRLTASELRTAHLADGRTERRLATSCVFLFGGAETRVSVLPFVMPRRPATRRPWASRVSRHRVLPARDDVSR